MVLRPNAENACYRTDSAVNRRFRLQLCVSAAAFPSFLRLFFHASISAAEAVFLCPSVHVAFSFWNIPRAILSVDKFVPADQMLPPLREFMIIVLPAVPLTFASGDPVRCELPGAILHIPMCAVSSPHDVFRHFRVRTLHIRACGFSVGVNLDLIVVSLRYLRLLARKGTFDLCKPVVLRPTTSNIPPACASCRIVASNTIGAVLDLDSQKFVLLSDV
ncbi:hypothetical protein B0H13DRAFT_2519682 [Mycena leptocephala]|nr:hypothetical protein B0H13DRAFT_2519682 [Mycena leptocephala]